VQCKQPVSVSNQRLVLYFGEVTTDALLVKRAQRGDRNAVDALLRENYDLVRAVCHRIVINSADAEDATQIALMAIVRALPSFDGRAKFSTWVYRIATNAALDELRRIRRRDIPNDEMKFENISVGDATNAVDAQMDVSTALAQVPEEFRVALVLRHIADLEYEEIAVILDVPVGTVRSRLSRGRAQLTALLGNQGGSTQRQNNDTGGQQ
jgi:RNA polymerase sigma-70 factor (ECF subfamily)